MTPDELPRKEAAKWLRQAAKDRNAAQVLMGPEPSRSVFHSQQAAEKAVKAFLTFHQIPFRKTHDLGDLGSQCASIDPSLEQILREVADLTDYASAFRYPDAPYEPDADEAAGALATATTLCDEIRRRLEGAMES
jgi:HEPN domain-containing protein